MSMPTALASSVLALVLSGEPAGQRYLATTVEVDVEPLIEQSPARDSEQRELERVTAERTGSQVRESVRRALAEQGVPIGGDDAAVSVVVRLEWKVYLDSHYVGRVVARHRDGTESTVTLECKLCDEPKLAAAVAARVPELLPALEVAEAAPPEGSVPTTEEPAVDTNRQPAVVEAPIVDEPKRAPLGATGKAGLGLLAVGAAGVITGGIVFAQRQRFDDDLVRMDWQGRDFGPPGVGVMIAGGMAAATGTLLLIVDRARARNARAATKPTAWPVPTTRGLAITGRF